MYKKVMVATDGSETAQKALEEAENIANSYNASLCIVYCVLGDDEKDMAAGKSPFGFPLSVRSASSTQALPHCEKRSRISGF